MKLLLRLVFRTLLVLIALILLFQLWFLVHILYWKQTNPAESSFMAIRLAELRERDPGARLKHQWVDYDRISIHLKRAVVAAEDDHFLNHNGFDWDGIRYALQKNKRRGQSVAGGSTISQQLAKNLFLSPSRSYIRKAQEAVITVMLETFWDKRRILEVYLNVVEWGDGVFGAEAAAQHYFQTPAANLTANQAARIAVLLPNPRRFERNPPAYVQAHARRVEGRMRNSRVP